MRVMAEGIAAHASAARPSLWKRLSLGRLLPNLTASLIAGPLVILSSVSYAALIFTGELAPHLAAGIGVALFGALVLSAVTALTSSLPAVVALPQDHPAVLLASIAASIASQLQGRGAPAALLPTVIAVLGVAALATGLVCLALGGCRVGQYGRLIPAPVMGGWLAGTGWLLAQGALAVMAGVALHLDTLPALFHGDVLVQWLPGVLYAGALLGATRRCPHALTLPAMVVAATGLFYLGLWLTGTSLAQARALGWLLGPLPRQGCWPPLQLADLAQVHWAVVAEHSVPLLAAVLLSTVSLLCNATGVAWATQKAIDLDRELWATGVANAVVGLGGGLSGYLAVGKSVLNHKLGADSRLVGLCTALMCAGTLCGGAAVLSYVPRPLLGGLLLYTGLDLLRVWVVRMRRQLPPVDAALGLLILGVMVVGGCVPGLGAGGLVAIGRLLLHDRRTCDTPIKDPPIFPHHKPTHQTSHAVKIILDDDPCALTQYTLLPPFTGFAHTRLQHGRTCMVVAMHHSVLSDKILTRYGERAPLYDRENRLFDEDFAELRQAGYLCLAWNELDRVSTAQAPIDCTSNCNEMTFSLSGGPTTGSNRALGLSSTIEGGSSACANTSSAFSCSCSLLPARPFSVTLIQIWATSSLIRAARPTCTSAAASSSPRASWPAPTGCSSPAPTSGSLSLPPGRWLSWT
jgi:MFS superfamily sulfate permease-like transporter